MRFDFGISSHFHSQICDSFRAHHVNRRNDRIRTISQLTICGTPAWFENLSVFVLINLLSRNLLPRDTLPLLSREREAFAHFALTDGKKRNPGKRLFFSFFSEKVSFVKTSPSYC